MLGLKLIKGRERLSSLLNVSADRASGVGKRSRIVVRDMPPLLEVDEDVGEHLHCLADMAEAVLSERLLRVSVI